MKHCGSASGGTAHLIGGQRKKRCRGQVMGLGEVWRDTGRISLD